MRPFREDMEVLANSHRTTYQRARSNNRPEQTWFAADMTITPDGDFLTGTLGYSERQEHREFDDVTWSWVKGATREEDSASEQTVVPFAVDLRDENRWVAFAVSPRLQHSAFRSGFENVLRQAVVDAGLIGAEWDVDLVLSRASVDSWIDRHPRVFTMTRTVKFSNPGRDFDDDRVEMRSMGARRKTEEFAAPPRRILDVHSEEFQAKLVGTETGDLELHLKARAEGGESVARFNSRDRADETYVEDFSVLEQGLEAVLQALREYSATRSGSEDYVQPRLGDV